MDHEVLRIVFIVCMLLWLVGAVYPWAGSTPPGRGASFVAWLAVLCLALLHGF